MKKPSFSLKNLVWYFIIGFFTLIIVISFGMPDFLSQMGGNDAMIAKVNGETIEQLEFIRFRDTMMNEQTMKKMGDKEAGKYILNALIFNKLQVQEARELGIKISNEKVKRVISSIPIFRNELGNFDTRLFERYLDHYRFTKAEYFNWIKNHLLSRELIQLVQEGVAVPPGEIDFENAIINSRIQIQYAFVSDWELKKKYKQDIYVSDQEVRAAMKSGEPAGDAKAAEARVRVELEKKKFQNVKRKVMIQVNQMARTGKTFNEAVRFLGAGVATSNEFQVGQPVRGPGNKSGSLASLTESREFNDDCLVLEIGKTSSAVSSVDGLYVFTPVKREIASGTPDEEASAKIRKQLHRQRMESFYDTMMNAFGSRSRIIRNPKFM
ncbi:MAG TPA: SurA N-terminal domain-containing protein [Spirochaetota bacterium]|nr:SurA N-terminal domain-containing protein [Spirochaetota bacterium]